MKRERPAEGESALSKLLRRTLGEVPASAEPAEPSEEQEVQLDVSGEELRASWKVLWALGRGRWEDFLTDDGEIVLGYPASAFGLLLTALRAASEDLSGGVAELRRGLAGPEGAALSELVGSLGLEWVQGAPHEAPAELHGACTLQVAKMKAVTHAGALRHLADHGALPTGGIDFGDRAPPRRGEVRIARETAWARSLSDEPWTGDTGAAVVQLLDLPVGPFRGADGPTGCYQVRVLRDGDRLVFDVGPDHLLHVQQLVLGLTAMEGVNESVSVRLEAASGGGAGGATAQGCSGGCTVRHRAHGLTQHPRGHWVAPPQTCSVVLVEAEAHDQVLVDRIFAATLHIPGGRAVGLYHAELFGVLLRVPSGDGGVPRGRESRPDFECSRRAGVDAVRCQDPYYQEELEFLQELGLLNEAQQRQLEELAWGGQCPPEGDWDDCEEG